MSIEAISTVLKHAPVQSGDLLILIVLADFADEDGGCWPSVSTLADRGRMTKRNAQICLKTLTDRGLVRIEKGAGPKGCNRYFVNIEEMRRTGRGGENISPLKNGTKGVKPVSRGGETHFTRTVIEPPLEPSNERERGRADENHDFEKSGPDNGTEPAGGEHLPRGAGDAEFRRAFSAWPTFTADSEPEARKAWVELEAGERIEAVDRMDDYVAAAKSTGRRHVCSFAKYLREKRWEKLPDKRSDGAAADDPVNAPPFGPLWSARRFKLLFEGPGRMPPPGRFTASQIASGGGAGERARLAHQAQNGFSSVRMMDEWASNGRGPMVMPDNLPFSAQFVPVPVGSATWEAWKAEHEKRGWPWLPDPGKQAVVYFPAGGPEALNDFEGQIKTGKGGEDDGGDAADQSGQSDDAGQAADLQAGGAYRSAKAGG